MKTASIAEVKAHFSAYVKASEQEPVIVTRNGKPVAVLLAVGDEEEVERLLMAHSPGLQAILEAARQRIAAGKGVRNEDFWAEIERDQGTKKHGGKPPKKV